MDAGGCTDPAEVLPDAMARLEQIVDDRVIAAVNEIKGHYGEHSNEHRRWLAQSA
jgi:hypothetical protein